MRGVLSHNPDRGSEALDEALIERAQRNPAEFSAIFDQYWNPVLRYCYYRIGDWHEAEDAAAQVFLNALSALPGFKPSGQPNAFKSWLFTIAFRVVSNHRRSETRHPTSPLDMVPERNVPGETLEEQAIARDNHELLFQVIGQLKPDQRQLIELRLAGLTDKEIGVVLGKSPVAIRKAQSRAVQALRELFDARDQVGGRRTHV